MSKLDKYFEYLGIYSKKYKHKDKDKNINDLVSYMLNRSNTMFKYHNLPDTIPADSLELLLQCNGFVVVCKINGNLYAVNAGLGGETDVYNRPTKAVISVPYLNYSATLNIDTDCIVMKSDTMAYGLLPMYYKYCTLINENEITMLMVNINQRVRDYLVASDDNSYESATQFIKGLYDGELYAIGDEALFSSFSVSRSGNSAQHVMKDLYEYEQYLKGSLYNEIGLAANYNMKRERLTNADIELNSDNLYPLVDDMIKNRRESIEKINALFDTDIEVEFNSSWDYRLYNGVSIHNTNEEITETDDNINLNSPDDSISTNIEGNEAEETRSENNDNEATINTEVEETEETRDSEETKEVIEEIKEEIEEIKEKIEGANDEN